MAESQLAIYSVRAQKIAEKLARAHHTTVDHIVEQALSDYEIKLAQRTPGKQDTDYDFWDSLKPLMEQGRSAAQALNAGTSDHADLYDEHGLPA